MAIRAILILGAVMLGCGSLGLLLVRLTSPLLRGLGYLGASFAAGSAGAGLLLFSDKLTAFGAVVLADLCVLGSFVLLHITFQELQEKDWRIPRFGICLMILQTLCDFTLIALHGTGRGRVIFSGVLIGAQVCQTVITLLPSAKQRMRLPVAYCSTLLGTVAVVNIGRSLAICLGFFRDAESYYAVAVGAFAVFVAIALGLGFGGFWMATTTLTEGLEQMASTDPLTRTYNRRVFLRWCERERERNLRAHTPFSILMIDFDHFKSINDTYGHSVGDEVLCTAVEHMQNAIRGIDVLGRWGGEEFTALLPGANCEAAMLVAERLRTNVARMRLPDPATSSQSVERAIRITVSVGVATYSECGDNMNDMLQRADTALYEAKALGRNRVVMSEMPGQAPWAPPPVVLLDSTQTLAN
ncbi:MAG TPA: GGDEF domain-containing protein [Acidobacteriaceae bacterium]|jgi:diguanylate cyclase (GGDEF)-like protein